MLVDRVSDDIQPLGVGLSVIIEYDLVSWRTAHPMSRQYALYLELDELQRSHFLTI